MPVRTPDAGQPSAPTRAPSAISSDCAGLGGLAGLADLADLDGLADCADCAGWTDPAALARWSEEPARRVPGTAPPSGPGRHRPTLLTVRRPRGTAALSVPVDSLPGLEREGAAA